MRSISCHSASRHSARLALARRVTLALLAVLPAAPAMAADARVPYVPTPQEVVDRMLEMGKVGAQDYLIDLGSGDGRIVVTAAKKYGTRGFGVDLNPDRIKESNENAKRAGVTDKVAFYQRNLFETDLSQATVITMYLLPQVNLDLRPKLQALVPGTRLVSHDFDMGDWKPDAHAYLDVKDKYGGAGGTSDVYLWIVPARAAGTWTWQIQASGKPQPYEMRLEQKHQVVTGSAYVGGRPSTLKGVTLRGTEISFNFTADVNGAPVKHVFTGRIEGDAINGTVDLSGARIQGQQEWTARRGARPAASLPLQVARTRAGAVLH